jgi:hypothetical protein
MTTDSAPRAKYELLVSRDELNDALRQIATFKRRAKGGRVKLTYANGELAISMPKVTIRVAAQGTWPSEVFTRSAWLWALAGVPPGAGPVRFIYDGRDLRVGTTVVPVTSARDEQ